jgi:hypothetical protein
MMIFLHSWAEIHKLSWSCHCILCSYQMAHQSNGSAFPRRKRSPFQNITNTYHQVFLWAYIIYRIFSSANCSHAETVQTTNEVATPTCAGDISQVHQPAPKKQRGRRSPFQDITNTSPSGILTGLHYPSDLHFGLLLICWNKQARPPTKLQRPQVPEILHRLINLLQKNRGVKDGMDEWLNNKERSTYSNSVKHDNENVTLQSP